MPRAHLIDQLAITALILLSTYLLIGDFGVRLANTGSDDGLVGYAYFFKYPELFRQDAHMLTWGPVALASMLNWLPAALFKYLGVPPEACYWLAVFLQNILLALAVYRFAIVATASREVALLSAIFTLAFRPHWWNIGLFADADWMPYAGWFSLPFLVYAGAFALERKLAATALTLLLGALVHPILGLFACMMMGGYWLLLWQRDRNTRELLIRGGVLAAVVAAFMLPVLVIKAGIQEPPLSDLLPMILRNGHTIPWANPGCDYCLPLFQRDILLTVTMTVLALLCASRRGYHPHLRIFLAGCAIVVSALCLLHLAAYFLQNVNLLRIITFRSTILMLVFAVPVVLAAAWREFRGAEPAVRLLAGYFIVLPSPASLVAILLVLPGAERLRHEPAGTAARAIRVCKATGLGLFALLLARHIPTLGAWLDAHLIGKLMSPAAIPRYFGFGSAQFHLLLSLILAYLCALMAWHWWTTRPHAARSARYRDFSPQPLALALAVPLAVYLLAANFQAGRKETSGEPREYYEVQVWARESTPPHAAFIVAFTSVYEGWRNFTHRPSIAPYVVCAVYVCPLEALAYDRKIEKFYAQRGKLSYIDIDAEGLREFARLFGGDYAVRRKTWTPLALPIAFENARYVVYDVR